MSKAITEKHDDRGPSRWGAGTETAPSVLREDEPTLARTVGLLGGAFVIFGGLALLLPLVFGWGERIGFGKATIILAVGLAGLLFHAAYDRDLQIRRLYWGVGGVGLFAVGALLCLIPFDGTVGALCGLGFVALSLSLFFILATLHHETDPGIRKITLLILGGGGAVGAALTFVLGNNFKGTEFLLPNGALLGLLSLVYLTAYITQVGITSPEGYRAALGVGAVGLLGVLTAVFRYAVPAMFEDAPAPYLVPWGLITFSLGMLYMLVSYSLWSEARLVAMIKRELASYFYSPLVYLILVGMVVVAWVSYYSLISILFRGAMDEPIIRPMLSGVLTIFMVSFVVPVLTMRLLSEERRTGSLEHLLTAPVGETSVVLSKFLAAFVLYLLMWLPFWLFLIALRIGAKSAFDYRPVFSFLVVLSITGANFVAMGLFFSSLTGNQVASAVLTFAGMMLYVGLYFVSLMLGQTAADSALYKITVHMSYIQLWDSSMEGMLVPRLLLFHASIAVLWLFMTVKVLEARRWA